MMPKVTEQRPTGNKKPSKNGSVWDQVVPVTQHGSGGIHLSLYGRGKTGKTRLISTFPKPALIMGSEDGTRSVIGVKGLDFVRLLNPDDAFTVIEQAVERGYKTLAIDTASRLADMILAKILGLSEIPVQKSWGQATRSQYGEQSLKLRTIMARALALPINVVITAHEKNFSEDSDGSELITPSIGSALSSSACGWLNGEVDYICQTFIREQVVETNTTIGGKPQVTRQKNGKFEYCLRTGTHSIYHTGFRVSDGIKIPDVIVNPTFDKIMSVINGTYKV